MRVLVVVLFFLLILLHLLPALYRLDQLLGLLDCLSDENIIIGRFVTEGRWERASV